MSHQTKEESCWDSNSTTQCSRLSSMDCWDYTIELECLQGPEDLQLAAELGKTLLERNKELESSLKQHQNIIEDQAQEIEYLTKQTVALREVNDSRLRIYEQLEVSIQDLERANHRLAVENATEKKHIKTLCHSIETLETKTEDLNKHLEETKQLLDIERRKNDKIIQENNRNKNSEQKTLRLKAVPTLSYDESNFSEPETDEAHRVFNSTENYSYAFKSPQSNKTIRNNILTATTVSPDIIDGTEVCEDNDVIIKLMTDLEMTKKHCLGEEQKVSELEEQLVTLIQENQTLQGRIAHINTNEEMKSVHEELSILEEVRQGQMCNRCLRSIDDKASQAEDSSMLGIEEDDDRSLIEMLNNAEDQRIYRSAVQIKDTEKQQHHNLHHDMPSPNPYRELVEKYEALLEVQRHSLMRNRPHHQMSMNDEFHTSGEFSSINTKDTDEESANGVQNNKNGSTGGARRKVNIRTPTDFSEAETSSSGFSDETSNKATQTDERSGYFLCTIADGDDCKFSIYDDASPIDSRFRNRPEYRELFKEIFAILKKAAENKDEGEKLPLLDDTNPNVVTVKAPPVTPATEDLPEFIDDNQSIISSAVSEQSFAMSERITKTERKRIEGKKHTDKNGQENKPPTGQQLDENGRVLTPLKRLPLEYLSVSVNIRKKSKKNRRNLNLERSDSPILPSPPRVYYTSSGKKRRDMKPINLTAPENRSKFEWNGNSMTIYNRNIQSPTPSSSSTSNQNHQMGSIYDSGNVEYKPSAASQDLHKLKKLDLSYAEVLRRADHNKHHQRRK